MSTALRRAREPRAAPTAAVRASSASRDLARWSCATMSKRSMTASVACRCLCSAPSRPSAGPRPPLTPPLCATAHLVGSHRRPTSLDCRPDSLPGSCAATSETRVRRGAPYLRGRPPAPRRPARCRTPRRACGAPGGAVTSLNKRWTARVTSDATEHAVAQLISTWRCGDVTEH